MAKQIYDKPTRALLKDMLVALDLKPRQTFTTTDALAWFAEHYPRLKSGSIRAHLVQASTNDRSRLHHSATNQSDDLLVKVDAGLFRQYEPGKDPMPIRDRKDLESRGRNELDEQEDDEVDAVAELVVPGASQFAYEKDLQAYLADNLHIIEPGLTLYDDEGIKGLEYPAGGNRRIDILAVDREGALVVLELKVEKGYERVVGQLLRYMNWVRKELAESGQKVRGIIVCRNISEDLRLACASIANVELIEYKLSVSVTKVPAFELP